MSDRGIKKWNAYKSLIEQTDSLRELDSSLKLDERPILSSDQEEEINELLVNYHHQEVEIKFYRNRKIMVFCGVIEKIDPVNRCLIIEDRKKILLSEVIGLKNLY